MVADNQETCDFCDRDKAALRNAAGMYNSEADTDAVCICGPTLGCSDKMCRFGPKRRSSEVIAKKGTK